MAKTESAILIAFFFTLFAMAWLFWYAELWEFGKLFHLYEGLGPRQDFPAP